MGDRGKPLWGPDTNMEAPSALPIQQKPVVYFAQRPFASVPIPPEHRSSSDADRRFEHLVLAVEDPWTNVQAGLAAYEMEGWELVSLAFRQVTHEIKRLGGVFEYKGYYLLTLKRPTA